MKPLATLTVSLPTSADPMGAWMERNHATIEFSCQLGRFHVHLGWKKLHSYSDAKGEHSEVWSLSRYGTDLLATIREAIEASGLK